MKWFCYGQEKRRWVCEEGTEDRPHNSAVLKPHQPKRERWEDKYGAGGALTGGVKRSLIWCPTSPSAQAGRPAGCCREVTPPYLPFGPQMDWDQFGGGRKNKGATCVLKCLFICTWGSCHWEAPAELLSRVERAFCCASDQCLASASLLQALCPPPSSLICSTHVTAAAFARNMSSL